MAAIANVGLDTTFDTWRIRTNRLAQRINMLSHQEDVSTITANNVQANVSLKVLGFANVQGQFTSNNVIRVKGSSAFTSGDGLEIGWLNSNNAYFAGYTNRPTDARGMCRFDFSSYQFDINGLDRFSVTNTGIAFSNTNTTAALSIQSANTDSIVHIETTSDSTAAGPILTLFRKPAAAAADDKLGQILFKGIDNAKARKDYAKITGQIVDHSANLEDGKLLFGVMSKGSMVEPVEVSNTGIKVNTNYKAQFGANTWIGQLSANTLVVAANTSGRQRRLVVGSNGVGVMTTGTYPSTEFHVQSGNMRVDGSYGLQFGSTNDRIVGSTNQVDTYTVNGLKQSIKNNRVAYSANIVPATDSTYDLGASGNEWQTLYVDTMHGTVATAAQPNITSLGTLTSLSVSGISTFTGACIFNQYSATTSGSVVLDYDTYNNFFLTLNGNLVLANPTTESVGQFGIIALKQDGTGSRTLSIGTDYESVQGAGYTLSTAAGATDLIPYYVIATDRVLLGMIQKSMA